MNALSISPLFKGALKPKYKHVKAAGVDAAAQPAETEHASSQTPHMQTKQLNAHIKAEVHSYTNARRAQTHKHARTHTTTSQILLVPPLVSLINPIK